MKSTKQLPARAQLEQLERQAKDLLVEWQAGTSEAKARVAASHPRPTARSQAFRLADAQLVIAREYGFATWSRLKARVESIDPSDPIVAFTEAACVPFDERGSLERAEAIRRAHPGVIGGDIFTAALLGDEVTIARLLERAPDSASESGGLYDWDPLTYLCFSKYLRLDRDREPAFVRSAELLLDHGASADTGFYWQHHDHGPEPTLETAIYGAAGVARSAALTKLLLERGADPNDDETPYHVADGWDHEVLRVLLESGKLDADSLTTLLCRKHDWHDAAGITLLLEHGADPNRSSRWGRTALEQALLRDNGLRLFEILLDHGAAPNAAVALAARAGRGDELDLFERRGFAVELTGADRLLAACARADADAVRALRASDPEAAREIVSSCTDSLFEFAGIGNTEGVRHLLDLGISLAARWPAGDAYLGCAKDSTALHVAAWCARHETVEALIARGAPIDAEDERGATPLALAVRACVDSYWTDRKSPASVRALLDAGASAARVERFPCGYTEVDELLRSHGR